MSNPAGATEPAAGQSAEWQTILTEGHGQLVRARHLFRYLPSEPRCKVCNNPVGGVRGRLAGLAGFRPSRKNPNLCSRCCVAGAFAALLSRFYATASRVLLHHDAVVDKLIGDEVMAFFVVNVAARLQQNATGGQLLVGEGVDDAFLAGAPRQTLSLRGRAQPIGVFSVGAEGIGGRGVG